MNMIYIYIYGSEAILVRTDCMMGVMEKKKKLKMYNEGHMESFKNMYWS